MYAPWAVPKRCVWEGTLEEGYTIKCLDEIESIGQVEYQFIVAVKETATGLPIIFVTSEISDATRETSEKCRAIGLFSRYSDVVHATLDLSEDWSDPDKFFPQAIEIARAELERVLTSGVLDDKVEPDDK